VPVGPKKNKGFIPSPKKCSRDQEHMQTLWALYARLSFPFGFFHAANLAAAKLAFQLFQ
jgi:hypothetical protein